MTVAGDVAVPIREAYPRVLAKVHARTRSLVEAEDAVHDAVTRALAAWPEQGVPESPEAWLLTVALNAHRDRARQARRTDRPGDALEELARRSPWVRMAVGEAEVLRGYKDELLRLLFAACHPTLEEGEGAALALATVLGLSVGEVAQAFVVAPRSMEQRLTRARRRLREVGDPDDCTATPERVNAVLRTIHLLFNEGYWASTGDAPIRAELCRLAIGLARSMVELVPDDAEAEGLLALLLLHDARRDARLASDGEPVPLPKQDRSRWDHAAIDSSAQLLERALGRGRPGVFQLEAAIAAVHCRAPTAESTDWADIAALYALLEELRPTPPVRVNRAFAVGKAHGAADGLELLERSDVDSAAYPYVHLVRGTLLAEMGRHAEARVALSEAARAARNVHERRQIEAQLRELEERR